MMFTVFASNNKVKQLLSHQICDLYAGKNSTDYSYNSQWRQSSVKRVTTKPEIISNRLEEEEVQIFPLTQTLYILRHSSTTRGKLRMINIPLADLGFTSKADKPSEYWPRRVNTDINFLEMQPAYERCK